MKRSHTVGSKFVGATAGILLYAAATPLPSSAQNLPAPTEVFIAPLVLRDSTPISLRLARYIEGALHFELLRIARLKVESDPSARCGGLDTSTVGRSTAPRVISSFVAVGGTIDRGEGDSLFTVVVEAVRCTPVGWATLVQEPRTFPVNSAAPEVRALAGVIASALRTEALPKVKVIVAGGETGSPSPANLKDHIIAEMAMHGIVEIVDTMATIQATVTLPHRAPWTFASLRLVELGANARSDSLAIERRNAEVLGAFSDRLAAIAARRVMEFAYGSTLRAGTAGGRINRDSALASARRALCIEEPVDCRPSPDAAQTYIGMIDEAPYSLDASYWAIKGRTDLARGDRVGALTALERALDLRTQGDSTTVAPEASERELRATIAGIYRTAGDPRGAYPHYQVLVALAPLDSGYARALAQTLRLAPRRIDAIRAVLDGLARFPNWEALYREAGDALREMSATYLADSARTVADLCRRDTTRSTATMDRPAIGDTILGRLAADCGAVFASRAAALARQHGDTARIRRLARAGIELAGTRRAVEAEASVALAASYLGSFRWEFEGDSISFESPGYNRDSVRVHAASARTLAPDSMGVATLGLLLQVEAAAAVLEHDMNMAPRLAYEAYSIAPTKDATALYGTTALRSFYASRNQTVWQEQTWGRNAKAALDSATTRYPRDTTLINLWKAVCRASGADSACAYDAARRQIASGSISSPRSIIGAVEDALLVDSAATALLWLRTIPINKLSPCEEALVGLFTYWSASLLGDASTASDGLVQWQRGHSMYVQGPAGAPECWAFARVKAKSSLLPQNALRERIDDMVRRMEERR
jgi:hypothetical protein